MLLVLLPANAQKARKQAPSNTTAHSISRSPFATPDLGVDCVAWRVCDTALVGQVCRSVSVRPKSELIVFGIPMEDSTRGSAYYLTWIQVGTTILTKAHITSLLGAGLQERIAAPLAKTGLPMYCHQMLPPLERLAVLRTMQKCNFPQILTDKQALMNLTGYAYSNIALYSADWFFKHRLRARLTPTLMRTEALEVAEQECSETDDIKKRIQKRQPVPAVMLESKACIIVKEYYARLISEANIESLYIVMEKLAGDTLLLGEPHIIGVVALPFASREQQNDPNYLAKAFASPLAIGTLTANELAAIPTKEFRTNDSTGTKIMIGESIENTEARTMLEYLQTQPHRNNRILSCQKR